MRLTPEQVLVEINAKLREVRDRPKEITARANQNCTHEWKKYRQNIQKGEKCTLAGRPYFIVLGCEKCKEKHYIDMQIDI